MHESLHLKKISHAVYSVEIILRMIGLGPIRYFTDFWRSFDFILIIGCLIVLVMEARHLKASFLLAPIVLVRYAEFLMSVCVI